MCLDLEKLLGQRDPQSEFELNLPPPKQKILTDDELEQLLEDAEEYYFDK